MKSVLLGFLLLPFMATAQVGTTFPSFEAETVSSKKISLPNSCKGKITLVGLASSRKAEDNLRSWAQPVYDKFISTAKNDIWDESYDVNLYFIPLFTGANQSAMEEGRRQAVKKTDSEWHPYLLFYKGKDDVFEEQLKMTDKDRPYFFVLDEQGKILYTTSGGFSQKKMDEIQEFLDR